MKYLLFCCTLFFTGCVSRQLANKAVDVTPDSLSSDIRFTYEMKPEFSTEYFGMVGFVLENTTNQWITIDSVEIDGEPQDRTNVIITGGNDINTWFTSMNKAKQIESINRQRLWGTISFISTLGVIASKNENVQTVAAMGALTGHTALTVERFSEFRRMIDLYDYFPEDHFMRTPFRIPPGLGVDKWMVVNSQVTDKERITSEMTVKVYINGGPAKQYTLEFIKNINKGDYAGKIYQGVWQKKTVMNRFNTKKK
jgi:hypothetical protein